LKILVTGGAGFAGQWLLAYLKEKQPKADLYNLDRAPAKIATSILCDLLDLKKINNIVTEIAPDQVYHLAAFASAASLEYDLIFKVNVGATENILKALAQTGKKVKILLISSLYVYGTVPVPAKETNPLDPHGVYAQSKAEMEKLAQKYGSNRLQIVIVRPANHTGPGQRLGFVIPDFAYQIAQIEAKGQKPVLKVGNLSPRRDFLDVRDVVSAYHLLMKKGPSGEVYNIATGHPYTIEEILNKLLALAKVKIKIVSDKSKLRKVDLPLSSGNPTKIKKIGWQQKIGLDQTLKDVLNYFRGIRR